MVSEILKNLALIAMLGVLTAGVNVLLKTASERSKYIKDLKTKNAVQKALEIIMLCVKETNQTFVKELKDNEGFTKKEGREAFNRTKERVIQILDEKTKEILESEYKNVDAFLNASIEAKVWEDKKEK